RESDFFDACSEDLNCFRDAGVLSSAGTRLLEPCSALLVVESGDGDGVSSPVLRLKHDFWFSAEVIGSSRPQGSNPFLVVPQPVDDATRLHRQRDARPADLDDGRMV